MLGKLETILTEAETTCDTAGAKLLVVYNPRKDRVYQGLCTFDADSEVPHYPQSDLPRRLGDWCEEQKIEYLDLTPGLNDAARQGKLVYLVDDPHWSPEGHEEVAAEVARRLEELHWVHRGSRRMKQIRLQVANCGFCLQIAICNYQFAICNPNHRRSFQPLR